MSFALYTGFGQVLVEAVRGGKGEERVMFKWRLQRCIVVHYVDEVKEGSRSREKETKV